MSKLVFWYILERLVRMPTFLLMILHEFLMARVIRSMPKNQQGNQSKRE